MMNRVNNAEWIEQHLGRWYPGDLAFIERLEYRCSRAGEPSQLHMLALFQRRDTCSEGWPAHDAPFLKVKMLFRGVENLQIKGFGQSSKQIMGFDIIDIAARRLEDLRFAVEDYEKGDLSFYCSEIEVLGVDDSSP